MQCILCTRFMGTMYGAEILTCGSLPDKSREPEIVDNAGVDGKENN